MSWRRPLLLLAVVTFGCSAEPGSISESARGPAAQPWEIDPYTTTREIFVDGASVGYLVSYDAIPEGVELERDFPTGGARILDRRFEDIGFVSPRGLFFRHTTDPAGVRDTQALGYHPLEEGLRQYFGGRLRSQLMPFTARPPAAASAAPTDVEGAEGEGAGEEDGAGEDG